MKLHLSLLTLCLSGAALSGCGGGNDGIAPDTSGDPVAKYIGTWQSTCYADGDASARWLLDLRKTSATSFEGKLVAHAYGGSTCSSISVDSRNVLTNMRMSYVGSKPLGGVTADTFSGTSSQGTGKVLLYADASVIRLGDIDSPKDSEGYPTAFYGQVFTRR
jgi:hypothetical protein